MHTVITGLSVIAQRICLLFLLLPVFAVPTRAAGCQVSLSTPVLDYGRKTREELTGGRMSTNKVVLPSREVTLNVLCQEPRVIRLLLSGAANGAGFAFGRRGQMQVRFKHALLDGKPVQLSWERDNRVASDEGAETTITSGQVLASTRNGLPVSGANLSVQLVVAPSLPGEDTRVSQPTNMESSIEIQAVN